MKRKMKVIPIDDKKYSSIQVNNQISSEKGTKKVIFSKTVVVSEGSVTRNLMYQKSFFCEKLHQGHHYFIFSLWTPFLRIKYSSFWLKYISANLLLTPQFKFTTRILKCSLNNRNLFLIEDYFFMQYVIMIMVFPPLPLLRSPPRPHPCNSIPSPSLFRKKSRQKRTE